MWDLQKTKLFNKIKQLNQNAKSQNYENKTYDEMLAIYTKMKEHPERYKNTNKQSKSINKTYIKPDKVSKEYADEEYINQSNNIEDYMDIDNKKHISFDIQEKQEEDYIPAPDEDEYGNTDLDYGYPEDAQRRDEIEKQTKLATKRFTDLCNTCGREHLLYEEGGIEGWTLRDFVSEAYYQYQLNKDSWYDDAKVEARKWLRFVQRFQSYLDDDIKCTQEHISKYDLL